MKKYFNHRLKIEIIFIFIFLILFTTRVFLPWSSSLSLGQTRHFDADEFQHSHSAWALASGQVPYRDYFEHHMPLFYFQLAPIMYYMKPEFKAESAQNTLLLCRHVINAWVACILILVVVFGYLWIEGIWGFAVGTLAASFLCSISIFWEKMIEIRPDVPAVAFSTSGILFLILGIKKTLNDFIQVRSDYLGGRQAMFYYGGFLLSCAVLCTQKVLFIGPGIAIFCLWYLIDKRWGSTFKSRLLSVFFASTGFMTPVLLISAWFASQGALSSFYFYNFTFNFNWISRFSPLASLLKVQIQNYIFVIICIAAVAMFSITLFRKASMQRGDPLIVLSALSGFCGLWIIPEPYLQSFQYILPLLALLSAGFCVIVIFSFNIIILAIFSAFRRNQRINSEKFNLELSSDLSAQKRKYKYLNLSAGALVVLFAYSSVFTPRELRKQDPYSNDGELKYVGWIIDNTSVSDEVFEDRPTYAVFRRHSWFFWSNQWPIYKMIPHEDKQKFVEDFLAGRVHPKLIHWGNTLELMPDQVKVFVKKNYQRIQPEYWIRK